MSLPLAGRVILVVEDDPIIGLDLQETLKRVGATVLGPSPDVARALELLDRFHVDSAVLDNWIRGGDSRPVADLLVERRIPFLFHTSQRQGLRKSYPSAEIIDKPSEPGELVRSLERLLAKAQDERRGSGAAGDTQSVGRTGVEPFDAEP
jgi:DNA-binding response OmpR family regulator